MNNEASMESDNEKFVMPGDVIFELDKLSTNQKFIFGPGLRRENEKIIAVKCGFLRKSSSKAYYIENYQKRYVPHRGENVIGTVIEKGSDEIKVDIRSSEPAIVDMLSFEGATKRNKPNINVGDLVYGKIVVACKDIEPEIVCVNSYGKSVGYGILPEGGFVFSVSLDYCRRLLSPESIIFKSLGKIMPFETAVGLNGRIWIKSTSLDRTLILYQAISVLEYASEPEIKLMCAKIMTMNIT